MRAPTLAGLVTVNFRQNLLPDVSAWADAACKDTLEDLEFRDNQLKEVRTHDVPFIVLCPPECVCGVHAACWHGCCASAWPG